MVINATAKSPTANCYVTLEAAEEYFRSSRPQAAEWDAAASTPDASGYVADGSAIAGASSVTIKTGTGTWTVGTVFSFASHAQVYTVTTELAGAGTLAFSPALVSGVSDEEVITRRTANAREEALIYGTSLLDMAMDWRGSKRDLDGRLRWPRSGVSDQDGDWYDYDTIPEVLANATCEVGLAFLQKNRTREPDLLGLGISDLRVGPISLKVSASDMVDLLPMHITTMLAPLGTMKPEAQPGGGATRRIIRV